MRGPAVADPPGRRTGPGNGPLPNVGARLVRGGPATAGRLAGGNASAGTRTRTTCGHQLLRLARLPVPPRSRNPDGPRTPPRPPTITCPQSSGALHRYPHSVVVTPEVLQNPCVAVRASGNIAGPAGGSRHSHHQWQAAPPRGNARPPASVPLDARLRNPHSLSVLSATHPAVSWAPDRAAPGRVIH